MPQTHPRHLELEGPGLLLRLHRCDRRGDGRRRRRRGSGRRRRWGRRCFPSLSAQSAKWKNDASAPCTLWFGTWDWQNIKFYCPHACILKITNAIMFLVFESSKHNHREKAPGWGYGRGIGCLLLGLGLLPLPLLLRCLPFLGPRHGTCSAIFIACNIIALLDSNTSRVFGDSHKQQNDTQRPNHRPNTLEKEGEELWQTDLKR